MSNFYKKKAVSGAPVDMEDGSRVITMYYSAFGNVDSDGDVIVPGAFTKTLKENDLVPRIESGIYLTIQLKSQLQNHSR